jgi:hypothetical protein
MTSKLDVMKSPKASSKNTANPWEDLASNYAPNTIVSALELCEFLYINDSTYRRASERIVNYFLTEFKLEGQAGEEMDKFYELLEHDFDMMGTLQAIGFDFAAYGNSFSTISFPFVRSVRCPKCKAERNIGHMHEYDFDFETGKINTKCPKCGFEGGHTIHDYKKRDSKAIKMIRWNPKLMTLKANRLTHDIEYWSEVPPEIKQGVKNKDKFYLRTTPKVFLDAIRQDKNFKFNNGHVYHMKEPHLAGLWLGGWGLPSILSSFKNFFRLQILRRYNEALMMDYIVPLRIISPAQGAYQDGNSIYNNLMREWKSQMVDAVERHRVDGTDWNFFPFPVNYQAVGGEGRQLSPVEMIDSEEDRLLNGRGIPPELYRSTMTLQAAPIALRVFERTWSSLVRGFNQIAQSSCDSISKYMGSGDYECEVESVKIIDDLENKAWRLQAMAAGQLSKETAMAPMGIRDVAEEFKKVLDEQRREQEMSQEVQQEMEMSQMGLGQQEEGQQGEENGGGVTPENINAQGDQMARQLLQMPESERRRQLHMISQQNEALHAVILNRMDKLRNQARSVGMESAMGEVIQNAPPPQESQQPPQ